MTTETLVNITTTANSGLNEILLVLRLNETKGMNLKQRLSNPFIQRIYEIFFGHVRIHC